jgi:signal peptidase I
MTLSKKLYWIIPVLLIAACSNLPDPIPPAAETEVAYRLGTRYQVNGLAMTPTLPVDSFVLVDETAYEDASPARGDLILLQFPNDPGRRFTKRVIGLPGEQIEAVDGMIFIDGTPLEEDYLEEPAAYTGSWEMGSDAYFVLGDNRNNSSDSHNWGALEAEFVLGKVVAVCESDTAEDCIPVEMVEYGLEGGE